MTTQTYCQYEYEGLYPGPPGQPGPLRALIVYFLAFALLLLLEYI